MPDAVYCRRRRKWSRLSSSISRPNWLLYSEQLRAQLDGARQHAVHIVANKHFQVWNDRWLGGFRSYRFRVHRNGAQRLRQDLPRQRLVCDRVRWNCWWLLNQWRLMWLTASLIVNNLLRFLEVDGPKYVDSSGCDFYLALKRPLVLLAHCHSRLHGHCQSGLRVRSSFLWL